MGRLDDAVHHRVTEVHVVRGHVYLGAEHHGAFLHLPLVHALEEVEVLLHGAVAVGGGRSRHGGCAFLCGYLFGCLFVHIGLSLLDEAHGQVVELREVVRGIVEAVSPIEAEPVDVALNGLDIFCILFLRIGVVKTQVAGTAELLCGAEVHDESLRMAYVEVTVGFRREAGVETSAVFAGLEVGLYLLFHEIESRFIYRALFLLFLYHRSCKTNFLS